jgi:hypothetical protein
MCVCLFIILQDAKIEQFCYSLDHVIILRKNEVFTFVGVMV